MTSFVTYAIYGMRISDHADCEQLDIDPGQCRNNGLVGYFTAGKAESRMMFLALRVEQIDVGQYWLVTRDTMFDERKQQGAWNDMLNVMAGKLGLYTVDGPGWFFVVDEA
jgi:hypothetical protein